MNGKGLVIAVGRSDKREGENPLHGKFQEVVAAVFPPVVPKPKKKEKPRPTQQASESMPPG